MNTDRFAMGLEYDGSAFSGFQTQKNATTVQESVEQALSQVADAPVGVVGAGRTDAGVHARCQVIHFDSDRQRSERAWLLGCNANLPNTLAAIWIRRVDSDFHARFSATARSYEYRIFNQPVRPVLSRASATWVRRKLNAQAMNEAAQSLLGEHDFSAFRAAGCQASHAVREVQMINVSEGNGEVILTVKANAFLYHMVRNIAGSLIAVGLGDQPREWIADLLEGRNRMDAGITAPPEGLTFLTASYPKHYQLPTGRGYPIHNGAA